MSGRPNRHTRKPSVCLPSQFLAENLPDSEKTGDSPQDAHEDPARPLSKFPAAPVKGSGQTSTNKTPVPETFPPHT